MAETRLCPQCGAELPTEAPEGLCPKCLLTAGLDDSVTDQLPAADAATIVPSRLTPVLPFTIDGWRGFAAENSSA